MNLQPPRQEYCAIPIKLLVILQISIGTNHIYTSFSLIQCKARSRPQSSAYITHHNRVNIKKWSAACFTHRNSVNIKKRQLRSCRCRGSNSRSRTTKVLYPPLHYSLVCEYIWHCSFFIQCTVELKW